MTLDKNVLFSIAKNLSADSAETAEQVLASKKEFPYSQVLHVLSAKLSKEFSLPSHDHELHEAAIYVADRTWLKEIMEMEFEKRTDAPHAHEVVSAPVDHSQAAIHVESARVESDPIVQPDANRVTSASKTNSFKEDGEKDVADALIKDLARLNELKHNFEMLFIDQAAISTTEDVKSADATDTVPNTSVTVAPKGRRKRKDPPQENLIEEIQITKSELQPESERQKQQIDIIDQFIKTQPSISGVKERVQVPSSDLNSFKTGEFSDNIISETLVEILVKQGKKERAIEVLKKLIWKYPQKKAYFASQIDDLKK